VLAAEGVADVNLNLMGLGGDWTMFNYSLSGDATLEFRQGQLSIDDAYYDVEFDPLKLHFERGKYQLPTSHIHSPLLKGKVYGKGDLVNFDKATAIFEIYDSQSCLSLQEELLHQRHRAQIGC